MSMFSRREFGKLTGGMALVGVTSGIVMPQLAFGAKPQVVVIGGGYGGAIAAKYIRMVAPDIDVTLIEKDKAYVSCPLSNPVIVGIRDIAVQTWGYDGLKKYGINVVIDEVVEIDGPGKKVKTKGGQTFAYDKLIVSPGVDFKYDAFEGYSEEVAENTFLHAWKAGPQTTKMAAQLKAMNDGDNFVIVAPPDPFRCPPGPYERAGLVAWYLKQHKPKSKVIVLDAKDKFSKQGLFQGGWKSQGYNVEWVAGGTGGKVSKVDAKGMSVSTDLDTIKGGVINIIPPQKAGAIAHKAGLVDEKGWCPVDLKTLESAKQKDIHVIGDACSASPMPKSGYAANSEAKIAAAAVVALLKGGQPGDPSYVNTCYSLISPDYGISVALVGALKEGKIEKLSEGVSPAEASAEYRKQEANYTESWYQSIMAETFT